MSARAPRLGLSVLCLCGLALLTVRCVRSGAPSALQTAYPVSPSDESAPESSTTAPVRDTPIDTRGSPGGDVVSAEAAAPPEGNPVARLMRSSDVHDRDLLAEVERTTGRGASAMLVELVQQRRAGASPNALQQAVEALPDLRERAAAQRWLRAVFPGAANAIGSSPQPGAGGGSQRLTPLQRVDP